MPKWELGTDTFTRRRLLYHVSSGPEILKFTFDCSVDDVIVYNNM